MDLVDFSSNGRNPETFGKSNANLKTFGKSNADGKLRLWAANCAFSRLLVVVCCLLPVYGKNQRPAPPVKSNENP